MLGLKAMIQKTHKLNASETTQLEMNCGTKRKVPYEEIQMTLETVLSIPRHGGNAE